MSKEKKFCQYYFKKNIKKNKFIALAMVDSENNMFNAIDGGIEFSVDIEEFKDRIKDFSYGCEVITTENHIKANKGLPFTDKTTVVLCDNVKLFSSTIEYKYRRNMKFIPKRDFIKHISEHEQRRSTPLFFVMGNGLSLIDSCIDVYELAKSDRVTTGKSLTHLDDSILERFKRVTNLKTETSEKYKQNQNDFDKNGNRVETIISGSMKVIKNIEEGSLLGYNYEFIRYER